MGTLAIKADERVKDIHIDDYVIAVDLMDGRSISVPLVWYPRLANASQKARENWQTSGGGYGIRNRQLSTIYLPTDFPTMLTCS